MPTVRAFRVRVLVRARLPPAHRKITLLLHNASRSGLRAPTDASGKRTYWAMVIAAITKPKRAGHRGDMEPLCCVKP